MKSYKGATPEMRRENLKLLTAAIKAGHVARAVKCNRCGQTQGIIMYHCEDYFDSLTALKANDYAGALLYNESLCWRCHMVHHSLRRAPEQCDKYWASVQGGKIWPPVFKHDFEILKRDHGIY